MLEGAAVAAGGVVLVGVAFWWMRAKRRGHTAERRESWNRHEKARERAPPVDIGDVCEFGVEDFSHHHSGERHAVGKVEGFVVFVEDIPGDLEETEVVRAKVLSYNRGHTSATATFIERV